MREGEQAEADKGYRGEPHQISVPDDCNDYKQRNVKGVISNKEQARNSERANQTVWLP